MLNRNPHRSTCKIYIWTWFPIFLTKLQFLCVFMFIHARYTFYVVLSVILLKTVEKNAQMHENCSVWWVRDFAEQKCISQLQKLIETSNLGFKLPNWPSQWICIETVKFHIWRGCHLTGVKNLPSHLVSILPHLSSMLQCFYVAPPKVSIWQEIEPKIIGKQWTYGQFCIQRVCHYGRCCVLSWKL